MTDFSQLFLYVPGIIIFLVGSGQVRRWISMRRLGACVDGTVIHCNHIVKTNSYGQETFNYYVVMVEYEDSVTHKLRKEDIKSPVAYQEGQPVRIFRNAKQSGPVLVEMEEEQMFHCLTIMVGGALLILLALFQNQQKEVEAMSCLALVLLGAGMSMILSWIRLKKRNLQTVEGIVSDVFSRQISKETKIMKGNKFTYYPVVSYQIGDISYLRKCTTNSSNETEFKIGDTFPLYYDANKHLVLEKPATIGRMIWGILLTILGLLVCASIISVLL